MGHQKLLFLLSLACSRLLQASAQSSGSTQTGDLPPYASGSLRGTEALLGTDGNPSNPPDTSVVQNPQYVPGQDDGATLGVYLDFEEVDQPQPVRGTKGGTDPGHRNSVYDQQNSDLFAAPGSDSGDMPNSKWPMGLSHNRLGLSRAGWARQQNTDVLPAATAMAGVDMRLEPHAYRELHWHTASEWSLIFSGSVRITAMDENGRTFIDDLQEGDVWFFPPGVPHSIQAGPGGTEFLLVFDQGDFTEEGTFLASEMFLRNPKSVLAKNFRTDVSAFAGAPTDQLYIFPGTAFPSNISEQNVTGPAGPLPVSDSYSYHWSQQQPLQVEGGSVKILDPQTFPIASSFSAALVTIEPGAMRELHWHLTSDEWDFFLQGNARLTAFSAPSSSRTFDFQAGDVGYVPTAETHYVENIGTENVVFLEVLQAPRYADISVAQWLGLTPRTVVKETLNVSDEFINNLPKYEQFIVPGNQNGTATNFTSYAAPDAEKVGPNGLRRIKREFVA